MSPRLKSPGRVCVAATLSQERNQLQSELSIWGKCKPRGHCTKYWTLAQESVLDSPCSKELHSWGQNLKCKGRGRREESQPTALIRPSTRMTNHLPALIAGPWVAVAISSYGPITGPLEVRSYSPKRSPFFFSWVKGRLSGWGCCIYFCPASSKSQSKFIKWASKDIYWDNGHFMFPHWVTKVTHPQINADAGQKILLPAQETTVRVSGSLNTLRTYSEVMLFITIL